MSELGLSEESAFKAIRSASMAHNISMIQLASTIIQTDPKQLPDLIRGR
jgi:AmiR/NasT family two-component response regulator